MINIKDVIGDCECFDRTFKEDIVELLEDTIREESDKMWKLKEDSPKFEYLSEKQSDHEELLNNIRPVPVCHRLASEGW